MKKTIFLLFFCSLLIKSAQAQDTVKIGYMVCNSIAETKERFGPLSAYLEREIGRKVEMVLLDASEFEQKAAGLDFAHTNSLVFLILNKRKNFNLLVREKKGLGGINTAGQIIARAGTGIKTLADLKEKRVIFGPMFSPAGYLAQYHLFLEAGMDPDEDLLYSIPWGSHKHDKVLYAVYYQAFDAGAARLGDIEEMVEKGIFRKEDFVVLAQSELIPYCNFSAAPGLSEKLVGKLKNALLKLTKDDTMQLDSEKLNIFRAAKINGFTEGNLLDYEKILKMAKRCNLPPFEVEQ